MIDFILYQVKAAAGSTFLYLIYLLFFSKDTFYIRNRVFLIVTLLVPLFIPLLSFHRIVALNQINNLIIAGSPSVQHGPLKVMSFKYESIGLSDVLILCYSGITILFFMRFIAGIVKTYTIINKAELINTKFPKVFASRSKYPVFSIFPFIVFPSHLLQSNDFDDILKHERAHIIQGHTFDLIIAEIVRSFQWFNPVIYFVKQSILLNHEYLADSCAIKKSTSHKEYQYRILRINNSIKNISFAHSFSNQIKHRLIMINKKPTSDLAKWKNLLVFPAIALLCLLFSFRLVSTSTSGNQPSPFSKTSESAILNYLQTHITYPGQAIKSADTGMVYVHVKMDIGGKIKECKAYRSKNELHSPLVTEVTIVGYKPEEVQENKTGELLTEECLRVSKNIGEINIPEWKNNSLEFALAFHFVLQ